MSDAGRKNFSDKVTESITPESQKTFGDKAKESVTDAADKFAANVTPNDQKSFGQTVADSTRQGHDDAKKATSEHQATLAETAEQYIDAAKEQVANAAEYISSVVTGALEGAKKSADETKK